MLFGRRIVVVIVSSISLLCTQEVISLSKSLEIHSRKKMRCYFGCHEDGHNFFTKHFCFIMVLRPTIQYIGYIVTKTSVKLTHYQ